MTSTTYNISEVHRITGKARSTIAAHMKQGKLSYVLSDDGSKRIEASEVARVYPDSIKMDEEGQLIAASQTTKSLSNGGEEGDQWKMLHEKERLERDRERKQLTNAIDQLRSDLDKSQERETRITMLLENHSKHSTDWKQQASELKEQLDRKSVEVKKYARALAAEREKSIWQKLLKRN